MLCLLSFVITAENGTCASSPPDFCLFSGSPPGPMTLAFGYALLHGVMLMWCSMSGAMMYWRFPPLSAIFCLTSGVNGTGENTARARVDRVTEGMLEWVRPGARKIVR